MNSKKIIEEIIEESNNNKNIQIGEFTFNTQIGFNDYSNNIDAVFKVRDLELFYNLLDEYLSYFKLEKYEDKKQQLFKLLSNASINDFDNAIIFVEKHIDFIKEDLIEERVIKNIECFRNSDIYTKKSYYNQETYNKFDVELRLNNDSYFLPSISYGISDNVAYIYAIQNTQKNDDSKYCKVINRILYKLNKNVEESNEYIEYKNGCEYYPHNISDVSVSAILSLSIFLKELEYLNIKDVKVVPYLMIRNDMKLNNIESKMKLYPHIYKEKENALREQLDNIQINMIDKLIRDFYRVSYHFNNIKITSIPFDLDEYLTICIGESKEVNNEILEEISKKSR